MDPQYLPLITFIATMAFIFLLRPVAIRIGLVDRPDERKSHSGEIPLVGGIAIYLAILATVIIDFWFARPRVFEIQTIHSFLTAAGILVVVGAWDDRTGLSPLLRLAAQVFAALIMVYSAGIQFFDLGGLTLKGTTLYLGWFAVPFTIFVTVGVINAINMCDGLDGLSGNMTLVSLLGLGVANTIWGDSSHLPMLNVISSGIIGFLVFNQRLWFRSKAEVFLGDAGSMMLGLALVWAAIDISQGNSRVLSPAQTAWFLAVPVFDTITMIIRRVSKGRSPFHADSEHLHHLLVRSGLRVGQAITVMCFLATLGCVVGLLCRYFVLPDIAVISFFVLTGIGYLCIIQWCWHLLRLHESQ